jgi:hypothetical protein
MVYVEMLGQDASFAYIKAVELCAATSVAQKKAGYLAGMLMEMQFLSISRVTDFALFIWFLQRRCVCHLRTNSGLCSSTKFSAT